MPITAASPALTLPLFGTVDTTTVAPPRARRTPTVPMTPTMAVTPAERRDHLGAPALSTSELFELLTGSVSAGAALTAAFLRDPRELYDRLRTYATTGAIDGVRDGTGATAIPRKAGHQLAAALELGRRAAALERAPRHPIRGTHDAVAYLRPALETLAVEEVHVLTLDAQHRLIRVTMITRGIANSSFAHPREIYQAAIRDGACAIIVAHNHPSGDPTPSPDDRAVTAQIVSAGRLLGIPCQDHVIIAGAQHYSFSENGEI